ncbi:MAG TPA: hypothetical protein VF037_04665 [Gemmatimonadales bacterium]
MTRFSARALAGLAALSLAACNSTDESPLPAAAAPSFAPGETGNGAPSGAHFTLNIIGMGRDKSANMDEEGGHVIFVRLGSRTGDAVSTKIMLSEGEFAVLDKNGTDGRAGFQLPAPAGGTAYQVYARPLGTPGGMARITTCAEQVLVDGVYVEDEVCSTENKVFVRESGRSRFENVTQELTTIVIDDDVTATYGETTAYTACGGTDTDGDDAPIRVDLFDSCLENYFWKYDNNGLRILQVRFYPAS